MKFKFMLALLMLSCSLAIAQNKITGIITDQDSLPLAGASIFVTDIHKGVIANKDGHYELSNLPSGKIKLQYSFLGYSNRIELIDYQGGNVELNVELKQTNIEAEEVIVSGGYNSTQHENAVKIDVLKINPLRLKATPNFAEMLTQVPGVDMISKGSGVSKPVIRGLSMNDILVLSNGVKFENYQYSSHHPLGIDEFGIDNVEIIKGPASLLYGSDAIGGVINFVKEKPAPLGTLEGDYNLQLFSNTQGITNNLGLKAANKKFFGGLRFGQKSNADYLEGGGTFVPNSRFNEKSLKANMGFTDKVGTFKLFYDYNRQKLGLVEEEALKAIVIRGRENKIWYQDIETNLLSSQNKIYLGNYKLDLNTAFQNTALTHLGDVGIYEIQMELSTLTYETKLHLPTNYFSECVVGFQGFNQRNKNLNDRETKLLPNALTNNYSGFVLLQKSFFDKLKFQTGIRYDDKSITTQSIGSVADLQTFRSALNRNFGSFSSSIGATYTLSDELLFRGNFAAAYRTPNIAEITSNGQHELRYEIGDQHLIPENAYESDLSLHYHCDNFTFDWAGFYNKIDHFIYLSPTADTTSKGVKIYRYQQSNSQLFGGESGLHIHPESIKWLHAETTFATVIGKQKSGAFLPFVPANKLRFELRAETTKCLFFNDAFVTTNSTTAFSKKNAAPDETTTTGYTLVDFSLGGSMKLMRQTFLISMSANNIFDTKYIDHLSTLKEVNRFNPGRNIALTLKVPFGAGILK